MILNDYLRLSEGQVCQPPEIRFLGKIFAAENDSKSRSDNFTLFISCNDAVRLREWFIDKMFDQNFSDLSRKE